MRKDLLAIVCCPVHKTVLEAKVTRRDEAGDILEGTLWCAACAFAYPVEDGIPTLLPPEYHTDQVKEPKPAAAPKHKGRK